MYSEFMASTFEALSQLFFKTSLHYTRRLAFAVLLHFVVRYASLQHLVKPDIYASFIS